MKIEMEYEKDRYIEIDASSRIIYLLGANEEIKWKLYRTMKRFQAGKKLSSLEENVYGDDGINIICDGQDQTNKKLDFLFLEQRSDVLEQLTLTKNTMLAEYLVEMQKDFLLNKQVEKINNLFLETEGILQEKIKEEFAHLVPRFNYFTIDDLLKKYLLIEYLEKGQQYPVEMMDITYLLDEYCNLIEKKIKSTGQNIWLVIRNPQSFIKNEVFNKFLCNLTELIKKYSNFYIFILSDSYLNVDFKPQQIESVVLIYENIQQLPQLDILRESLARRYPEELTYSDQELIEKLMRIFPYVGIKNINQVYLNPKDMVLFKVVGMLLYDKEFSFTIRNEINELTPAERCFLGET